MLMMHFSPSTLAVTLVNVKTVNSTLYRRTKKFRQIVWLGKKTGSSCRSLRIACGSVATGCLFGGAVPLNFIFAVESYF